jgi:hypothetical protein
MGSLGWVSLGWVSLGWVSLGWVSLGWVSLGWVSLGWVAASVLSGSAFGSVFSSPWLLSTGSGFTVSETLGVGLVASSLPSGSALGSDAGLVVVAEGAIVFDGLDELPPLVPLSTGADASSPSPLLSAFACSSLLLHANINQTVAADQLRAPNSPRAFNVIFFPPVERTRKEHCNRWRATHQSAVPMRPECERHSPS